MAWRSVAGFQSESTRTRREAPVRLRPTPPALEERRKARWVEAGELLKRSMRGWRAEGGVEPSRRRWGMERAVRREERRVRVEV